MTTTTDIRPDEAVSFRWARTRSGSEIGVSTAGTRARILVPDYGDDDTYRWSVVRRNGAHAQGSADTLHAAHEAAEAAANRS